MFLYGASDRGMVVKDILHSMAWR